MLPAAARLRRSQDFSLVLRRGRRAGRSRLVVHVLRRDPAEQAPVDGDDAPTRESGEPTRVGFVVSKAVGNAVVRHRVSRQLRHLVRERLAALPAGTLVVVRALPPAAAATSRELGRDIDRALGKLGLPVPTGPSATRAASPAGTAGGRYADR